MADSPTCPICRRPATKDWLPRHSGAYVECEACGNFEITGDLNECWNDARTQHEGQLPPDDQALLPYLSAATRQSATPLQLRTDTWQTIAIAQRGTPVGIRVRRLLEWLASESPTYGAYVRTDRPVLLPAIGAHDQWELKFLLDHLVASGQIQIGKVGQPVANGATAIHDAARLTVAGWDAVSPSVGGVPGTCFVAMSFDKTLIEAYRIGIKPAVELDCGFAAIRVDQVEHNDDVTDRILAGIRSAQFMVADFTLQKQGVYYEAGFAEGLGRSVVWCCRDTDLGNLHFDTRNRNHVVWTDPGDLRNRLTDRIRATIPGARQT